MNTKNNTNAFKKYFLHSDNDKFDAIAIVDSEENACIFYADQLSPKPDKPLSKMSYSELCGFDFSFLDGCSTSQEVAVHTGKQDEDIRKIYDLTDECKNWWIIPKQPLSIDWDAGESCYYPENSCDYMLIDISDVIDKRDARIYAECSISEEDAADHYLDENGDIDGNAIDHDDYPLLVAAIYAQLKAYGLPTDIAYAQWIEESFQQCYEKCDPRIDLNCCYDYCPWFILEGDEGPIR